MGKPGILELEDGWTIITEDGSLAAHYENTILITENEPENLDIIIKMLYTILAIMCIIAILYLIQRNYGGKIMSKEDVIEVEGTVVETLPNTNFKSRVSKWSSDISSHLWKIKNELYKNSSWR